MTTAQRLALAGLTLDGADLRDESGAVVGRVSGESAALRGRVLLPLCGVPGLERACAAPKTWAETKSQHTWDPR